MAWTEPRRESDIAWMTEQTFSDVPKPDTIALDDALDSLMVWDRDGGKALVPFAIDGVIALLRARGYTVTTPGGTDGR